MSCVTCSNYCKHVSMVSKSFSSDQKKQVGNHRPIVLAIDMITCSKAFSEKYGLKTQTAASFTECIEHFWKSCKLANLPEYFLTMSHVTKLFQVQEIYTENPNTKKSRRTCYNIR